MEKVQLKTRSPNFPVTDLRNAVELAKKLEDRAQQHPLPIEDVVTRVFGLKTGSSYGRQIVAALRQFGLVQVRGAAAHQMVQLTPEARKIALSHGDSEELVKEAALNPRVHSNIWEHYNGQLPPDETLNHYLLSEYQPPFNKTSIDRFLSQFKETLEYAGLSGAGLPADLSNHGSLGELREVGAQPDTSRKPSRESVKPGMKQDTFNLDEGEVVLQWPMRLSKESLEEFEAWLDLILRRARRSVPAEPNSSDDDEGSYSE